ncbi:MAG: hypothetical protein LBU83_03775 [Bacteroidales bacterium]|jgi:hypothetical protein|nr:hypothetical protein [Bacteroidales bacterium]
MKRSYHTDFSIQYKLGLLNKDIYRHIPKSTLYSWGKRDFSKMIGYHNLFTDEKLELIRTFLNNQSFPMTVNCLRQSKKQVFALQNPKRLYMPMCAFTAHWITLNALFTLL